MQSMHSNYSESEPEGSKKDDGYEKEEKEKYDQEPMFFPFDEHWILAQKFSWEKNISISANKLFDTFAFINSPEEKNWVAS